MYLDRGSLNKGFPAEMFLTSLHHFRQIMCSTKYTLEQKDEAFGALCQDYIRCNLSSRLITAFVATEMEWAMRRRCDHMCVLRVD